MRIIAAYMLAVLGGTSDPTPKDIKKILDSVGVEFDEDRASTLCDELKGKKIDDLIEEGASKLASVPAGGAVVAAVSGNAAAATSAAAAPTEEKAAKKADTESDDEDMGFSLFD